MNEVLAGQRIRAADWNRSIDRVTPYDVIKLADETLSNTTTYQNDNEIAFPVEANRDYKIDYMLRYGAINTVDFKHQWVGPAGCTWTYRYIGIQPTDTTNSTISTASGIDYAPAVSTSSPYGAKALGTLNSGGGSALGVSVRVEATLRVGASSGTFQLQWAQNNAVVADLTVSAGSWLSRREMVLS